MDQIPVKRNSYSNEMMNLLVQSLTDENDIQAVRKQFQQELTLEEMKVGLEFFYMNGLYQDLERLIEQNLQSESSINQAWANVYQMFLNQVNEIETLALPLFETDDPGLNCLTKFISIYDDFLNQQFNTLGSHIEQLSGLLEKDEFHPLLKKYFHLRLAKFKFIYHWKRNEIIIGRKYAYRITNQLYDAARRCRMEVHLAETFLFENYQQAIYHAEEALKLAIEHKLEGLKESINNKTIPLIRAFHGKSLKESSPLKDIQAVVELKKGNYKKAVEILNSIQEKNAFHYYCLGLCTEDRDALKISYQKYITEQHDHFYAQLPLKALQTI